MAEPRSDLTQASRQIARGHIDLAFWGVAKQPMQILVASSYTMGASAVAAALCAVVSFIALAHLAVERRAQRRAALPAPHLRWRVRDGFWVAAVAVTPVLLLAVALICFRPDLHAAFPENLVLVAVGSAVATPALLAGLSSGRVWRRLQEAGGTGGPSVFWPVLVWVFLMVLGATVLLGRPLGLTGYSTQAGPPAGGVVMPLAIALAVVGVVGFVVSAVRALARRSPSVAERAQRTAWLVRAFTLAVLVLVLFTFAAAFVTADRFDACWRESAEVLKAETTHYLGQVWIKKYFPRPDEAATQPASAPAATPAAPDS